MQGHTRGRLYSSCFYVRDQHSTTFCLLGNHDYRQHGRRFWGVGSLLNTITLMINVINDEDSQTGVGNHKGHELGGKGKEHDTADEVKV